MWKNQRKVGHKSNVSGLRIFKNKLFFVSFCSERLLAQKCVSDFKYLIFCGIYFHSTFSRNRDRR